MMIDLLRAKWSNAYGCHRALCCAWTHDLWIAKKIHFSSLVSVCFWLLLLLFVCFCIHKTNERVSSNWPQLVSTQNIFLFIRKNNKTKKLAATWFAFAAMNPLLSSMLLPIKCGKNIYSQLKNKFHKNIAQNTPNKYTHTHNLANYYYQPELCAPEWWQSPYSFVLSHSVSGQFELVNKPWPCDRLKFENHK